MKQRNLLLSAFLLAMIVVFSCNKEKNAIKGCTNSKALNFNSNATKDDGTCQIVDPNQRYLVLEIGAAHCAPCGSYAIPALEKTIQTLGSERIIPISIHANGDFPLHSQTSVELANSPNYYNTSIPRFAGGSELLFVGVNRDIQTNVDRIKKAAEKTLALLPIVNSFVQKNFTDTGITVEVTSKFHNSGTGDFYLAVYILEDGIVHPQLIRNPAGDDTIKKDMIHNHVLRTSIGPTFGTPLISGIVEKNHTIKKVMSKKLIADWKRENLHIAIVIWKRDSNGKYYFENGTVF